MVGIPISTVLVDTEGDAAPEENVLAVSLADWPATAPLPSGAAYQAKAVPAPFGEGVWLGCFPVGAAPDPAAVNITVRLVDVQGDNVPERGEFILPPGLVNLAHKPALVGALVFPATEAWVLVVVLPA